MIAFFVIFDLFSFDCRRFFVKRKKQVVAFYTEGVPQQLSLCSRRVDLIAGVEGAIATVCRSLADVFSFFFFLAITTLFAIKRILKFHWCISYSSPQQRIDLSRLVKLIILNFDRKNSYLFTFSLGIQVAGSHISLYFG